MAKLHRHVIIDVVHPRRVDPVVQRLKRRLRAFEDALKPGVDAEVSKAAVKIRRRFAATMLAVGWIDPTTAAAWRMALVRTGRCLEISDRSTEPCTIATPMDLCVVCAIHHEGTL